MANMKITKSKYNLSSKEQKACHGIIHTASGSAAAVGAGLAQLPLADNAVITPIQITMIVSLGKVFDQEITKAVAKGILGGVIANFVGRGVAQVAWGWIPGIGNASNAITAATITESIGWLCVDHFYKEKYFRDNIPIMEETNENMYGSACRTEETENAFINKEDIKTKAMEFISGQKTRTGNKEEYLNLMNEFDKIMDALDNKDELRKMYDELLKIK